MKMEFQFSLEQARNLGYNISQANLTQNEGTITYQSRWLSLSGFYLPITCLTLRRCEKLQVLIYNAILSKLGFNQHIPLCLRYGPTSMDSAGFIHKYTEQTIKHIQYFVGTIRQQSEWSDSIIINLSSMQLKIGISTLFHNINPNKITYIHKETRHGFLWKITYEAKIRYDIPSVWKPSAQRVGYLVIIDALLKYRVSP